MHFIFQSKVLEYLRQEARDLCIVHNAQIEQLKIVDLTKCRLNDQRFGRALENVLKKME